MSIVLYKEVGFTDAQIGMFSKGLTGFVTIVFSILGSIINARFGLIKGLMIGGISADATASLRLHRKLGFQEVGRIPGAGHKFGRSLDLVLMARALVPGDAGWYLH